MSYKSSTPQSKARKISKRQVVILVVLVIILAGLGIWKFMDRKPTSGTYTIPSSVSSKTKQAAPKKAAVATNPSSSSSASSNTGSKGSATSSATAPPSGVAPISPSGSFVSNHSPGQNGSSKTQENSVCNTTPGASCYIQFTNGKVIQKLTAQTADSNGSTSWNWDPSILSSGSWQITAVATLNGQTVNQSDSRPLVIQ